MSAIKNLSEQLFKPQFCYPETSSLVQRIDCDNHPHHSLFDGEDNSNWYRIINRLAWHFRGLPLIEVEDVLARIAICNKHRTNDKWLDTVIGYESGNWIYEFLAQSSQWQKKAEKLSESPDIDQSADIKKQCHQAWLMSSQLAGLASYPYYRNDDLANQAQFFAMRAYREAMNYCQYEIRELDFSVDNKIVKGHLHTPLTAQDEPRAFPIVFLCSGLSNLQIDFYHYFADYLAPLGIGLLTIDTPSIGLSRQFDLSQNTSKLHQSVLEQLPSVPLINDAKVILMGYRFGANIATRLAYLMPNRIKGLINIAPVVHQFFIDADLQATLPIMLKDMLASRLGLTRVSNQQLMAELKFFSLKEQRLLSRPCTVPVLNITFEGDLMSPESESRLLVSAKKDKLIKIKKSSLKESLQSASEQSSKWINGLIK